MSFRITVTKIQTDATNPALETTDEIFSQTIDDLNLPKFVTLLNKQPRQRKAKVQKAQ